MVSKCQDCNDGGVLYDQETGKRCAECGWKWKPKEGLTEETPTRPHNADCGELIIGWLDNPQKTHIRKRLTNDGDYCSVSARTVVQLSENIYMSACTHHS